MSFPVFLAVALSLVSAICYATAAVVQERTAARTASVRGALTRGSWWWSVGLNAGGALLHVVALRYGPLTLVQPLGALSLVVAVPLGSLVAHRRTSGTQWRGMALTLVGLAALLAVTVSGHAPDDTLHTAEVLLVVLAAVTAVTVLVRFASARSAQGGLALAAASGIASGVGSTLAQKLAVGPVLSWSTVPVAVLTVAFAVAGLLLSQKAYRSGLGAPLALLTLVNPVTASAIGITLLGEGFQYGETGVALALAGAGAAVHGVTLLSRSQPRHDQPDHREQRDQRDHRHDSHSRSRSRVPYPTAPSPLPGLRAARLSRPVPPPRTGVLHSATVDTTGTGRGF